MGLLDSLRAFEPGVRDALRPIAKRHGASVSSIAIAWDLSWPGVTAAIVVPGGPGPAPVTPDGLITTFQPGELQTVPDACGTVPAATVQNYLPGQVKQASPLPIDGSAGSACDWTIDHPPVYRLLELSLLAYAPSGLASGDGSATYAAIDAYGQTLQALQDLFSCVVAEICRRLEREEASIATIQRHQLGVRPLLHEPAALQHQDAIREADRRESVRDEDRGSTLGERPQPLKELELRDGVKRGCRLVEDENARFPHERSGEGNLLPLPAGEVVALVEPLAEHRLVPLRKPLDQLGRPTPVRRALDGGQVLHLVHLAQPDVLLRGRLVVRKVLVEHAHLLA